MEEFIFDLVLCVAVRVVVESSTFLANVSCCWCPGSPQMAEKHKHSRENACLSPRERPVSAIFPNALDPSQVSTPEALATQMLTLYPMEESSFNCIDKLTLTSSRLRLFIELRRSGLFHFLLGKKENFLDS